METFLLISFLVVQIPLFYTMNSLNKMIFFRVKLFSMMNNSLYNDHDFTNELVKSAFDSLMSMESKLVESSQSLVTLHNGLIFCQRSLRSGVICSDFFFCFFY